jgi:endonuclease/exonuclease/phosphatase family metal-dependent hydrolase
MDLLVGWLVGCAILYRVLSPFTVVQSMTLQQHLTSAEQRPIVSLRVGSYNIAHGRGGQLEATNWDGGIPADKRERLRRIGSLLSAQKVDIAVLNEVDFRSVWSGNLDESRIIADAAGLPYVAQQANVDIAVPGISVRFGNAVLSRFPISQVRFLDYPNTDELGELLVGGLKEGMVATLDLPGDQELNVIAVHLSVNSEAVRIASAEMILDVRRKSATPLLVMGDFNTAPKGYPQHHEDEQGRNAVEVMAATGELQTSFPGLPIPVERLTFPSEKPARLIDWVFVSKPWEIKAQSAVVAHFSDHLPVFANLVLPGPAD